VKWPSRSLPHEAAELISVSEIFSTLSVMGSRPRPHRLQVTSPKGRLSERELTNCSVPRRTLY